MPDRDVKTLRGQNYFQFSKLCARATYFVALFFAFLAVVPCVSGEKKDTVDALEEEQTLEPEYVCRETAAPRVRINDIIIEFSCKKTPVKDGVIRFCPLSLDSEATSVDGLTVRKFDGDLLANITLMGGEGGDSIWTIVCRISGKTGRLVWKSGYLGFNMGRMLITGDIAYNSSIGMVVKADLRTGKFLWKYDAPNKYGYYNNFKKPRMYGGTVIFTDSDGHKIEVDDATGRVIRMDVPEKEMINNPWVSAGAIAVSGYMFYEMLSDKNPEMAWTLLAVNAVGWTGTGFFRLPLLDDNMASFLAIAGMTADILYPLIAIPYSAGIKDNERMWRGIGGVSAAIAVPILGVVIYNLFKDDKPDSEEESAVMFPVFTPQYAGMTVNWQF